MQKPSENNLALCQIGLMAQLWYVSQEIAFSCDTYFFVILF